MILKAKGVKQQIEEKLLNGENREVLNNEFNKGTVTTVYNKLIIDGKLPVQSNKVENITIEKEVVTLIENIIKIIDNTGEYVIEISVNKKLRKNIDQIKYINPFKLYGESGKMVAIEKLSQFDIVYLKGIIKNHFNYDRKELDKINSVEALVNNIIGNIERTMKIGDSFR